VSDDKTFDEFHLKENVKNIHNLSAVVCAVHGNGTYDVQYRDGDFDRNIDGSLLKKIVVQKQKHVNKKNERRMVSLKLSKQKCKQLKNTLSILPLIRLPTSYRTESNDFERLIPQNCQHN
jgi:hypothetical protein